MVYDESIKGGECGEGVLDHFWTDLGCVRRSYIKLKGIDVFGNKSSAVRREEIECEDFNSLASANAHPQFEVCTHTLYENAQRQ